MAANIDMKTPCTGEVVHRLKQLANERNIDYDPSLEAKEAYRAYCERKRIAPLIEMVDVPVYNPDMYAAVD